MPTTGTNLICKTVGCLLAGLTVFISGCDWDDDDHDHNPPAGQGAIIVDNNTVNDIRVFFNGEQQADSRDGKSRAYNLNPGVYRVVLDEKGGDRSYRGDVDVLENRLTIMDVSGFGARARYDVFIYFD